MGRSSAVFLWFRHIAPIMENPTTKNMEDETETGIRPSFVVITVSDPFAG